MVILKTLALCMFVTFIIKFAMMSLSLFELVIDAAAEKQTLDSWSDRTG